MSDAMVEFLQKVSALAGVSEEGLELLSGICQRVEMKAGDVIIKEDEEGDCVFIIEQGQVEISMSITMGPNLWEAAAAAMDKVLVKLGPGAMFGEMAFIFDRERRSATITATSEGSLLRVSSSDFRKFAEEDMQSAHRIVLNIAKIIAERLKKTNHDMKKLTTVLTIALRRPKKA